MMRGIATLALLISGAVLAACGGVSRARDDGHSDARRATLFDGGERAIWPQAGGVTAKLGVDWEPPCFVAAPAKCPNPPPRFEDVAPIFANRCASCHSPDGGPWPLTDYDHVAAWADLVQADLFDCSMPPSDAGISITHDEEYAVVTWIACGAPM